MAVSKYEICEEVCLTFIEYKIRINVHTSYNFISFIFYVRSLRYLKTVFLGFGTSVPNSTMKVTMQVYQEFQKCAYA